MEESSLVQHPTRTEGAAGNSWPDHLQRFKGLDPEAQVRRIYESAGLMRRVSVKMRYRTIEHVKDGFGNRTGSCREYTLPREDQNSGVELWIEGNTEIGPVFEVRRFCHLHVCGIESLILPHLEIIPSHGCHITRHESLCGRVTMQ